MQGPIRIDEEDEDLRWDSWSSESGPTMGPLRGVLKPVDRDNIQGVPKKVANRILRALLHPLLEATYDIPTYY